MVTNFMICYTVKLLYDCLRWYSIVPNHMDGPQQRSYIKAAAIQIPFLGQMMLITFHFRHKTTIYTYTHLDRCLFIQVRIRMFTHMCSNKI